MNQTYPDHNNGVAFLAQPFPPYSFLRNEVSSQETAHSKSRQITIPSPPNWLSDEAKWKWNEIWPRLNHRYFDLHRDGDLLSLYCSNYSTWREASEKLKTMGSLVKDVRKNLIANPFVAIRDSAEIRMTDLAGQLGLRPDGPVVAQVPWSEIEPLLGGEDDDND